MKEIKEFAYCYASGLISFGPILPPGTFKLLVSTDFASCKEMHEFLEPKARLAYDNKTLLVPGIPEAKTRKEKVDAYNKFVEWLNNSKSKSSKSEKVA